MFFFFFLRKGQWTRLDFEFWTIKRLLSEEERTSQNTGKEKDGSQGTVINSLWWTMMSDVEFEVVSAYAIIKPCLSFTKLLVNDVHRQVAYISNSWGGGGMKES